jgi:hypothetical protein
MASPFSKKSEERQLRSPIALPERMNGIEFRKEVSGVLCKCRDIQASKISLGRQIPEQAPHLTIYVLRIRKHASPFRDPNSANPACPRIYVLKQMAMYGAVMGVTQSTAR